MAQNKEQKEMRVSIETQYGKMLIKLYNETPLHRDNFIKLVKEGSYDGTLFHRVIGGFMVQGGDPESKNASKDQMLGRGSVGYTIPAEFVPNLIHKKGALAAARTADQINPEKVSSGCQFYIVDGEVYEETMLEVFERRMGVVFTPEQVEAYTTVGGTPHLDGQYTVFGEVIEGFDVLDKIASTPVNENDRPMEDIKMTMKIVEE